MKIPKKPFSRKGFTLVELLVVIAIIAVLAAAGFAVGPAMMNRAKKLSAQAGATSIANAVEQFYSEYSALPDPGSNDSDTQYSTTETNGVKLLAILAGIDDGDQNPRKMRFLTAKEANKGRDGIVYGPDGDSIEKMVDPWGQPYFIMLDYGYNEQLQVNPGVNGTSANLNGKKVAVYSLGTDKQGDANAKTLVKSW